MKHRNSRKPRTEFWSIIPIVKEQEIQERPRKEINIEKNRIV